MSSPPASQRPCSRSPPRRSASYTPATSRDRPSVRIPSQGCKRSPSSSRPSSRSRVPLLPIAWPPDRTYSAHDNNGRAHSSPANAHSDSAAPAAAPVTLHENAPHSSNFPRVQSEIANRLGCAPPAFAPRRSTFPRVAFLPQSALPAFPPTPCCRRHCSPLPLLRQKSRVLFASHPDRKFFGPIRDQPHASDQTHTGTRQSPLPNHSFARSKIRVV